MKNIFVLPWQFYLPIAVVLIGCFLALYLIVINNLSAKDVTFSFVVLFSASVMFFLNVCFGLKDEQKIDNVYVHLTLDSGQVVDVLSHSEDKSRFVVFNRDEVSRSCGDVLKNFLKDGKVVIPERYESVRGRLDSCLQFYMRNMVIGHLIEVLPDWNINEENFRGSRQVSYRNGDVDKKEGVFYSKQKIDDLFGNKYFNYSLSNANLFNSGIVLPPKTVVSLKNNNIIFDNPFFNLELQFFFASGATLGTPVLYDSGKLSLLVGGENSCLNIDSKIVARVLYKKLNAGNFDRDKYTRWVDAVLSGLRNGFDLN